MESAGMEHATEVGFCRRLFIWMNKRNKGFSDEEVGLGAKVGGEDGVEINELEVGREQSPILGGVSFEIINKKENTQQRAW